MKKLVILFMVIMLTGCSCITPETPFFGGFIDDTPKDLAAIHNNLIENMVPTEGIKRGDVCWADGKLLVHPGGGCTNYVNAVRSKLLEAGYRWDQIEYLHCSIYDTKQPDHVVLQLTTSNGKRIFDSRFAFVQRPGDYSTRWTGGSGPGLEITPMVAPYIWWAWAEDKWTRVCKN